MSFFSLSTLVPFSEYKQPIESSCSCSEKVKSQDSRHLFGIFNIKKSNNHSDAEAINPVPSFKLRSIVGMENGSSIPVRYCKHKIESVIKKLNLLKKEGVFFDNKEVSNEKITNGLCSAISLAALRALLSDDSPSLISKLASIATELQEGAPHELALVQAAFNTITLEKDASGDKKHAKMQSLANAFDLELDNQFEPIAKDFQLTEQIATLQDGAYCLRMLWHSQNHKEEAFGHTLVLVKENNQFYLLDSGRAFYYLGKGNVAPNLLKVLQSWGGFNEVRIYPVRLSEKARDIRQIKKIEACPNSYQMGYLEAIKDSVSDQVETVTLLFRTTLQNITFKFQQGFRMMRFRVC